MPIEGTPRTWSLAALGLFALVVPEGDDVAHPPAEARFAPPVRMKAGDAFLGGGRTYPSPSLHDLDGDGRLDVVVGDLAGNVTVATGLEDGGFAKEAAVKNREGEPLTFDNW